MKIKIYDTAGQEKYKSASKQFIQVADIVLVVYSINDKKSFKDV